MRNRQAKDKAKDSTIFEGAMIDLGDNYRKGADILVCDYQGGVAITQVFTAATGVFQITGKADITEYTHILNAVKFTSTSTVERCVETRCLAHDSGQGTNRLDALSQADPGTPRNIPPAMTLSTAAATLRAHGMWQ